MNRWRWALLPALLCSLYAVMIRSGGQDALTDTDTSYLLSIIRANPDPVSGKPQSVWNWFTGDWPLHNHFYRPISTLSFEMDTRLHGNNGAGYILTNTLIAACCILLLFWFLRELTDNAFLSGMGAFLFGVWTTGYYLPSWLPWLALPVLIGGIWRGGLKLGPTLLATGSVWFLISEIYGKPVSGAILAWLPGRTASIMTAFCLVSLAAYARYLRLSAARVAPPERTPLDPPATRNTRAIILQLGAVWPWLIVSFVGAILALGSHEQAIMLPGAIVGVAVSMRMRGYLIRWEWPVAFFVLLVGYLVLRHEILPQGISKYQAQQLRTGPGTISALLGYVVPDSMGAWSTFQGISDVGMLIWITALPYVALWNLYSNVAGYVVARRWWNDALAGWALSIIAFLPMAWVKAFPHYDYWPMAMRSLFVAALMAATGEAILSAWSPRAIRLPGRLVPAPGSLPHP